MFIKRTTLIAKKQLKCHWCGSKIPKGKKCARVFEAYKPGELGEVPFKTPHAWAFYYHANKKDCKIKFLKHQKRIMSSKHMRRPSKN